MNPIHLQPAYVLHRRPYRETSFIVELFTPEYGRLAVVAKGMRKLKSSAGLLQPFTPLLVSWTGKGELMSLTHVEANGEVKQLRGECLFAGFYLNELMIGLLQKWDAHPGLFQLYENTITALQVDHLDQKTLRIFEKGLLEDLGYGLLAKSHQHEFTAEQYYRFVPEHGFVLSELGDVAKANPTIFSGKSLLAIINDDWDNEEAVQDAKRLTRYILTPLLGARQIHSRKLFVNMNE